MSLEKIPTSEIVSFLNWVTSLSLVQTIGMVCNCIIFWYLIPFKKFREESIGWCAAFVIFTLFVSADAVGKAYKACGEAAVFQTQAIDFGLMNWVHDKFDKIVILMHLAAFTVTDLRVMIKVKAKMNELSEKNDCSGVRIPALSRAPIFFRPENVSKVTVGPILCQMNP